MALGDAGEAGLDEGCGVVGEGADAEVGEDAEGEVEAADVGAGDGAHGAGGRDSEIRDEPECVGAEVWGDAGYEGFELGLGEAV